MLLCCGRGSAYGQQHIHCASVIASSKYDAFVFVGVLHSMQLVVCARCFDLFRYIYGSVFSRDIALYAVVSCVCVLLRPVTVQSVANIDGCIMTIIFTSLAYITEGPTAMSRIANIAHMCIILKCA